ncbi:MAG TPA: universal stress protein [Syntrophorhabdaceae bacterium]|jgi:nucleotide-binding universal stress UspA family protein
MFKPQRILVPTDFSEFSDKALAQALDIANQYDAGVHVLHVIHEEMHRCAADYCIPEDQMEKYKDQLLQGAAEDLRKQVAKFPEAVGVEISLDVKKGIPYEAILEEQKEKEIDLIVIASLGKTGIMKYLMGSVAQNVIKGAHCAVLVIR